MHAILLILLVVGLVCFVPWLLMICWNLALVPLVLPFVPNFPELGFWTAFAIVIICNILFKSSSSK